MENPYAFMNTSFKNYQSNTLNTSLKITQNFDFITKGLKATALINFKNWSYNQYTRTIEPYFYRVKTGSYDPATIHTNWNVWGHLEQIILPNRVLPKAVITRSSCNLQ